MKSKFVVQNLQHLWEWWKRVARKIGDFQARVILTFFYFVLFTPFALALRLRADPLSIKAKTPRGWLVKDEGQDTLIERATRQF